ncbi:hypothetical protein BH24ACT6_BH24ACT6_18010 [soil metagenome]
MNDDADRNEPGRGATGSDGPGPDDPTVARLRRGLDRLTGDIGAEPPGPTDVPVAPPAPRRPRWLAGAAAAAVVGLVVAAGVVVATRDTDQSEPEIASLDSATAVAKDIPVATGPESGEPDQLYRAVATVLASGDHGPQLCLGAIAESYPPQCGGLDVTNWTWDDLTSERASGTRWGEFVVVGTYDPQAQTFTLAQPALDAEPGDYTQGPDVDFPTPCDEPEGGWPKATEQELIAAAQRIESVRGRGSDTGTTSPGEAIDGFGGLWIAREPFVLNVRIVGDLAAADATIRTSYDGPLCLVPSERTLAELQDIQDEIGADPPEEMSTSNADVVSGVITVDLIAPNASLEASLAERYGDAVVVQVSGLIPIAPGDDPDPGPGTTPGTAGPVAPAPATVPPTTLDPDTPVSSPSVRNGFENLEIELVTADTTVQSGRILTAQLHLSNRSGETVTDPGCVLGSGPFGLVPVDDPNSELWQQYVMDCSGPFEMPDGYDDAHGSFDFAARTKFGEPLPPGEYIAALEIEGYGRLEQPVTVR